MAMQPTLFSINGLATELRRDRRVLAKALRGIFPDGERDGHPTWFVATAMAALRAHDRTWRHDDTGSDRDDRAALEHAAIGFDALLDRMRAEPDLARRRDLLRRGGGVTALEAAIERIESKLTPDALMVQKPFFDQALGMAMGEALALCGLKIKGPNGAVPCASVVTW